MTAITQEPTTLSAIEHHADPTRIRWSKVSALARKDLLAARQSRAVLLPMLIVPLLLLVVLPSALGYFAATQRSTNAEDFVNRLPNGIGSALAALPPQQRLVELVLGYMVAPLFLIVPMMVSAALGADSIAGEKERKTFEGLLHQPITDQEIFIAKIAYAFIPTVAISWGGFALYCIAANLIAFPVLHTLVVPTWHWAVLIGFVAPAVAALGVSIMVRVSARSNTTQDANQLGGAVIMPIILTVVGQSAALLMMPIGAEIFSGVLMWMLALALMRRGMSKFDRNRLAARL